MIRTHWVFCMNKVGISQCMAWYTEPRTKSTTIRTAERNNSGACTPEVTSHWNQPEPNHRVHSSYIWWPDRAWRRVMRKMRQGTCGRSPKQMRNNDSMDLSSKGLFRPWIPGTYTSAFWSHFWLSLTMSSICLYIPSRTARGGLTATELVYARMPCYHGQQDFLTSKTYPASNILD